jgi:hypothetical protein
MTDRNTAEAEDELSEQQRIELLEKSVSSNKVILLIVALILIITISVAITTGIVNMLSSNDQPQVKLADFQASQKEIAELKKVVAVQNEKITQLVKAYPELKTLLANSSAPSFQKILLEQEKSYQDFLTSMKSGMYDLAHMVPGSRTWLEMYNEQMNKAITMSQKRSRELEKISTGKTLIEPNF